MQKILRIFICCSLQKDYQGSVDAGLVKTGNNLIRKPEIEMIIIQRCMKSVECHQSLR